PRRRIPQGPAAGKDLTGRANTGWHDDGCHSLSRTREREPDNADPTLSAVIPASRERLKSVTNATYSAVCGCGLAGAVPPLPISLRGSWPRGVAGFFLALRRIAGLEALLVCCSCAAFLPPGSRDVSPLQGKHARRLCEGAISA